MAAPLVPLEDVRIVSDVGEGSASSGPASAQSSPQDVFLPGRSDFGRMAAYAQHVRGLQHQLHEHEALQFYTVVMLSRLAQAGSCQPL